MTIHFSTLTNTDTSSAGYAAFVNKLMAEAGDKAAITSINTSSRTVSGTITFNGATYTLPSNATQWTWQQTATVAWDKDAGVLAVYSNRTPTESTSNASNDRYASCYVYVLIAGGHLWWGSGVHDKTIAEAWNVGTGMPRAAADTTRAMLTPLIADGIDMTPVFVSQNFVIDTAGTTVTDTAGNKFVSLGNLLYLRDTAVSESAGTAVTCRVGSVSTLPAGSHATVTNSGTLNDIVLDFGIPAGAAGPKGDKGDKGATGATGPQGPKGDQGPKGEAGVVTPAAAIADLTAAPTARDFNALLNVLRVAGLMNRSTSTPPAQTETVDVFIGDSTTAVWATAPLEKNWTTLISNADGVKPVNTAVVGAGFVNDAGKNAAYPAQVTTAISKTQGKTVRRVFLVGLWNDQNTLKSNPSAVMTAASNTADMIKSAWPGAQLLYIVEVAPQTDYSTGMATKFSSAINQAETLFEGKGFNVARNWLDWMPNGKENGYMHDTIHPNAKAMNVAAHKIREWVNTLSGPKITGEIPAWSE